MGVADVKMLYATGPRGVRASIPLVQAGAYDVADIAARLKQAGVRDDELPFVVFTSVPPEAGARPALRDAALGPAPALNPPAIPVPTKPDTSPPLYSDFVLVSAAAVTASWRQQTGCRYSMKRPSDQGYVVVQDLQPAQFKDPEDYARVTQGRIRLCYGLVWRQAATPQFLRNGDQWVQRVETTHGMSSTSSVSVTASVGYSGYGASASISATYSYSVTVDEQTKVSTEVSVLGVAGVSKTAVLWELCRKYVVEVDGVLRDETNPFTIVYLDKGEHLLQDTWGPTYEVYSPNASMITTPFNVS
ncbi:MAG: hypothetical protein JNL85_13400 [Rubrivivax sp.]|nr:hypothetical protein [Rubrivivax sp.]